MKKLLLSLFVIAITNTIIKAQCPPGAFAYQSTYSQCPSGCGVLLIGWPEGVIVNIYGGSPLNIISSVTIPGTYGGSGVDNAFTCVPCNTPLVYASAIPGATNGCVIVTIGVVPVRLINFSASLSADNFFLLNWSASLETGSVKYVIQKSENGRLFTDIATINGTLLPVNTYSYKDLSTKKGSFFYRIKVVEISGNTFYSEIVLIKNENEFGFSIYPNPAVNEFKITLPGKFLPANIEIINAQGIIVYKQKTNQATCNINKSLSKGVYAVKVTGSNNSTVTQRLIKN